jgi:BirA family biotin operon repressor/biotin-[acetyl-CoA-carboxylase] ligase
LIQVYAELGSTSTKLLRQLAKGEAVADGTWIVADRQTDGRGRHGRAWHDGAGNFMGSTFVRQAQGDPPLSTLALVAGLAVSEVVSGLLPDGPRPLLKWPNDLLVEGSKISGILLEGGPGGVVVGIGVNLAVAPKLLDRPTTSLKKLGIAIDRDDFAQQLADTFDQEVTRWRTYGLEPIIARWLAAAHPLGTELRVGEPGDEPLLGTFAGLDPNGSLQLRLADGGLRAIHAGEVNLAGRN